MKCSGRQCGALLTCVVAGWLVLGWAASARAELDYEFAKMLLERDEPSFSTEDLIQRLTGKLDENPAGKTESALIKATVKRRQARTASAEKKNKLLEEVDDLYKQVLAGDAKFKHRGVAEKEKEALVGERIKATKDAAKDLAKSDPNKARAVCHDAALQMAAIAVKHKTAADAAEELFKPAFKKYQEWVGKNDPNGEGRQPPKEISDPLEKNFDAWIISDKYYVAAKVEQLECYDDSDPDKKPLSEELAKYCDTKANHEVLMDFPVITAWYNFMLGRVYSCVQNPEKATEAWQNALSVDPTNLGEELKKQMFNLKKQILVDLVKMKMKASKFSDVEGIIVDALIDPNLKTLFEEFQGKDLLIDYAKALTLQPDASAAEYEKAMKKLGELVQKERSKGANTDWANSFARTMAELLQDARKKNIRPRLSAEEWYEAARGFYLMGVNEYRKFKEYEKDAPEKAKEQFEKAYKEYENAVDYYRRAISTARSDRTDLATRLEIEPKAWFDMGIAYLQMKHYYECVIVYQAMRASFLPDNRKKWLPDQKTQEGRKFYTRAVTATLEELDKLLTSTGVVMMGALDQNAAAHRHPQDFWNRKLKGDILTDAGADTLDPGSKIKDVSYVRARTEMDEAKGLSDAAKMDPDVKTAEENYSQAVAKWMSAADKFGKIKLGAEGYEAAMYQVGSACTLALGVVTSGRLPSRKMADLEKLAKELSAKALDGYQKYLDFVAKNPVTEDEDKQLRSNLEGAVLLARSTLFSGAADWPAVIKSADDYILWEQRLAQAPARSSIDVALLNKFRAEIEMTGPPNFAPKCDPYLKEAEKVMNELMKLKPNDKKLHLYMLTTLSDRNNIAAFQAEKFIKEGKLQPGAEDAYEDKVAELQEKRVDMTEEDPTADPKLEDYSRLVYLFNKTGKYDKAVMVCKKLLEKFDPQNKNVRIPDEPKVWQSLLARMKGDLETNTAGIIKYNDINKDDRCKKDHMILMDYMYDTREGRANADTPTKRPAFDKYNMDMDKALKQLETIYKNYPDCQTLPDPQTKRPSPLASRMLNDWIDTCAKDFPEMAALKPKPEAPKSFINFIEDEIDYRRKIEATRDLLSSLSLEMGEKLAKEGKDDEAKKYRELANDQIKILLNLRGDTPQMQLKTAEIDVSIGNLEEALNTLYKIKHTVDRDKEFSIYFDASRKISEVFARQKKWREAAEFPEYLAITAGLKSRLVKEKWPRLKDFLKDCYANGVPCPPKLAQEMEADEKKDDTKKDEPKPDQPKPDEAKKDEPKPDQPKPDEAKKDEPKPDQPKPDEAKKDEPKAPEPKPDDAKKDAPKAEEKAPAKADEAKKEEAKPENK